MVNFSKIKRGLLHPNEAVTYVKSGRSGILAKKAKKGFFSVYCETKQYNSNHSKYPLYFDFCKWILIDSVSDEKLRTRFFNESESIKDFEMKKVVEQNVDDRDLTGLRELPYPERAHTMIGLMRLENLQLCLENTIKNNIPGDLIETGVWRGGASIFMKLILKKYGINDKTVFVADSFEGLPKPDVQKYPKDTGDNHYQIDELKINLEEVKNNFQQYGVLDDQVQFLKGWFKDTLKNPPFEKLSILRLDGDMYGSTWDVLENLYDKLSVGGYLIIDDYALYGCKEAITDFRLQNKIKEELKSIDGQGVYWKKLAN